MSINEICMNMFNKMCISAGDILGPNSAMCYLNELVQERCNSIANGLDLRLSYTNPSISCHMTRISAN